MYGRCVMLSCQSCQSCEAALAVAVLARKRLPALGAQGLGAGTGSAGSVRASPDATFAL